MVVRPSTGKVCKRNSVQRAIRAYTYKVRKQSKKKRGPGNKGNRRVMGKGVNHYRWLLVRAQRNVDDLPVSALYFGLILGLRLVSVFSPNFVCSFPFLDGPLGGDINSTDRIFR